VVIPDVDENQCDFGAVDSHRLVVVVISGASCECDLSHDNFVLVHPLQKKEMGSVSRKYKIFRMNEEPVKHGPCESHPIRSAGFA